MLNIFISLEFRTIIWGVINSLTLLGSEPPGTKGEGEHQVRKIY